MEGTATYGRGNSLAITFQDVTRTVNEAVAEVENATDIAVVDRTTGTVPAIEVVVTPRRGTAAPFSVFFAQDASDVTLSFGRHSIVELYENDGNDVLADLAEKCRAIVEGHVSETLWLLKDGRVARSTGYIESPSKTLKVSHHSAYGRFARKTKRAVSYSPYAGPSGELRQ